MEEKTKEVVVMGAGLVGSLLSLYLAKKDYKVDIYERRPDMRKAGAAGGRSINLALSDRGWKALRGIGIEEQIREVAIPMYKRVMHDEHGNLTSQPYGEEGQAIYSVSRGGLNMAMMDLAEENTNVRLFFEQQCVSVDLDTATANMRDLSRNEEYTRQAEQIFGTDGAFSMVRNSLMMKTDRFEYSQSFLEHGYKELNIPATADGGWALEKNALHIWPRGHYMMIALPNLDGSFTCTLFFPFEGDPSFEKLKTRADVEQFFNRVFPDAVPLMPTLLDDFFENPTSSLVTVKCFPWAHKDKVLILGDASHAIVPFYGQGMNAGFEDCTVFNQLLEEHGEDLGKVFAEFQKQRKPDADAIADLAVMNFVEMRDKVADPRFLLQKKIESQIHKQYPDTWTPLYSMVTFSDKSYSEALAMGLKQEAIMSKVMPHVKSPEDFNKPEVQEILKQALGV